MIEFDKFIYFRLQKCASSYTRDFLLSIFKDGKNRIPGVTHPSVRQTLIRDQKKIWLGTIRNPWKWYVSWYHFSIEKYKEGDLRFANILLTENKELRPFEDCLYYLLQQKEGKLPNMNLNVMGALDLGLLAYRYFNIYGNVNIDVFKERKHDSELFLNSCINNVKINHFVDIERGISEQIYIFLIRFKIPFEPEKFKQAAQMSAKNESAHNDYRDYYGEDLIELIEHKERHIIKKFNYEFENYV